MNADPQKVRSIFLAAVENHAPDQWRVYLDEACGGDPELRERVEVLLGAHQQANRLLDAPVPVLAATTAQPIQEGPGTVIGPYKLLQQIGEGGMGTVFMAEQTQPVQRKVALKIIKVGMDSRQVIARFEAERQALALMDHPSIARVLEAGATDSGRPYFVMELVKGTAITRYCDEHHLTPRQRMKLFVPVCQAVQHAHQKGIIHRDLKPSNVLIALYDGKPVPKVIDFGVAKAAGPRLTEKTMFTEFGQVVGTLEYMSPEQAELNQLDSDTRTDIYSLGVLLYELLTGTTPLDRKRLQEGAILEMLRCIREEEPPKPSTRLSTSEALPTLSTQRSTEPAKLAGLVRGELDWIVMKALEKDRNRRYETANGMAQDIQRYLDDEPVQAGPPSAGYRISKFVKRHRAAMILTGLFALLLVAATVVSSAFALWADKERTEAITARNDEKDARQEAVKERNTATTYAIRWMLDQADRKKDEGPENLLWLARALAIVPQEQHELESFIRRALTLGAQDTTHEIPDTMSRVDAGAIDHNVLAVRPDGQQLLVASADDSCGGLWNFADKQIRPLQPPPKDEKANARIVAGAFSPKGRFLFAWTGPPGGVPGQSYLWETASGRCLGVVSDGQFHPNNSFFTPDEKLLVVFQVSGGVEVMRPETLERQCVVRPPHGVSAAQLHSGGRAIWTYGGDHTVRLWQLDEGKQLGEPWQFPERTVAAFSPDRQRLLIAAPDGEVRVFDLKTRQPLGPAMQRSFARVSWPAVDPNAGQWLVISKDTESLAPGFSSSVVVFDTATARVLGSSGYPGHSAARFVPDNFYHAPYAVWMPDGNSYWNGSSRYFLSAFPGDANAARLWAEVVTFHEVTASDEVRLLEESAWEERRKALQEWASSQKLPESFASAMRDRTRWLIWRIDWLINVNKRDQTFPLYDRLIHLDPSPQNFAARGGSLLQERRYTEAIADLTTAIQKDAALIWTYHDRGRAYAALERWPDALRDFEADRRRWKEPDKSLAEAVGAEHSRDGWIDLLTDIALLQWATGDNAAYRASCEESRSVLKRLKIGTHRTERVLRLCSLLPGGQDDLAELHQTLVEAQKRPGAGSYYAGLDVFLYRSGKFQEIIDHPISGLTNFARVSLYQLRALAFLKLGRKDEAKKSLDSAQAQKAFILASDWSWQDEIHWRMLQRELEALKP